MARQRLGEVARGLGVARDEQLHPAAEDDGVVGAAHGLDETWRRRWHRRRGDAVDDVGEREVQLMRLVQRHLEAARRDLHRAGEARCRRIDEGEAVGLDVAGLGHLLDQRRRRRAVGLDHEAGAVRLVAIAKLLEQLLRRAERARGA